MRWVATDYAFMAVDVTEIRGLVFGVLLPIMRWGLGVLSATDYAFHEIS
jgi:hypothetical protein